ncbi:MFS transporter [Cytobacillus sp. Hz8]|uniref:MFS transporter n=1 Tax=Cytobacillus sp. Hz8 TaxID=3347168 RepID=UPI0035E14DA8
MKMSTLHINVRIRVLDVFLHGLSNSMFFPFMSIYFASHFGAKLTGILMIFTVIFGFGVGLYAGYFSDIIGRKKIILVASITRSLGLLFMALANTNLFQSTAWTFLAFIIVTASSSIAEPVAEAMLIDATTNDNRKHVYGFMYWFNNLAIVIGAVIGGFYFTTHLFIILLVSFMISFVSVILIFCFISDTYKHAGKITNQSWMSVFKDIGTQYKRVSMDKVFMIFTLATLLFFTLEFQVSNYIGIRLAKEIHIQNLISISSFHLQVDGTRMLGLLNAENTMIVVTLTLIVGKMMSRYKNINVLIFGLLLYTFGTFVMGYSNAPWFLLAAGFFAAVGEIMFWPVRQYYLADLIPENTRSSYMAVNSIVGNGGSMLASLFITIGAFVSPVVISGLYIVIGLLCIWLFKLAISMIKEREKAKKFA